MRLVKASRGAVQCSALAVDTLQIKACLLCQLRAAPTVVAATGVVDWAGKCSTCCMCQEAQDQSERQLRHVSQRIWTARHLMLTCVDLGESLLFKMLANLMCRVASSQYKPICCVAGHGISKSDSSDHVLVSTSDNMNSIRVHKARSL